MTRTIAVANQKGGVGKTTSVINIGVSLAEMEKKVLLIDLDPQAALSAGLGIDPEKVERTVYTLLVEPDVHVRDVIRPIKAYLDLMPASSQLAQAEIELIPEIRRELTLHRALKPLAGWYDFILIDCPPSLGLLTTNGLCASSEVLVPLQCEYFAMRGLQLLLEHVEKTKVRLNPDLELVGILATMYSTGTIHAREVLEDIRDTFGDKVFDEIIYNSIRFAEASVANQAIVQYANRHKGARAYKKVAADLIARTPDRNEPAFAP
jgi:chromosome partitioning protein